MSSVTIASRRRAPDPVRTLRARRVARRTERIEPFDAFYQAYVTVLLAGLAILLVSGWVGDGAVSSEGRTAVEQHGAAVLGLVSSVAIATGLRSGSRGGPLAVEEPDLMHVLLGPVDRGMALRPLAVRQLRFLVFTALVVGVVGGQFAARRLDGGALSWMTAGVAWAVTTTVLAVGAAWLAGGTRLRPWVATAGAIVLVGWAVCDVALTIPGGPTTVLGHLALWPLQPDAAAAAALVVAVALGAVGLSRLGGTSLERMRHRSSLVGHMRFAATMRDIRTVMIVRRQLSHERPRRRPWLSFPRRRGPARAAIVLRDWRSLMRTPATRLARMAALGVVAGAAAGGAWTGTTPLVVVAGLASFLAGLEALEPLAQEIDHSALHELLPIGRGRLFVEHLVVPSVVMVLVIACGFFAVVAGGADTTERAIAAITIVPAGLAGAAGASISTLRSQIGTEALDTEAAMADTAVVPELTGMKSLYSSALPPAVAAAGFVPVLLARRAAERGLDPIDAALSSAVVVLVVVALVFAWIRYRDEIGAWKDGMVAQAQPDGARPTASR